MREEKVMREEKGRKKNPSFRFSKFRLLQLRGAWNGNESKLPCQLTTAQGERRNHPAC